MSANLLERVSGGEWRAIQDEFDLWEVRAGKTLVADCDPIDEHEPSSEEAKANAKLIALAPDHALWGRSATMAALSPPARWEPFNDFDGRGELCVGGLRYSTKLDACGIPALTAESREALRRAIGIEAANG